MKTKNGNHPLIQDLISTLNQFRSISEAVRILNANTEFSDLNRVTIYKWLNSKSQKLRRSRIVRIEKAIDVLNSHKRLESRKMPKYKHELLISLAQTHYQLGQQLKILFNLHGLTPRILRLTHYKAKK